MSAFVTIAKLITSALEMQMFERKSVRNHRQFLLLLQPRRGAMIMDARGLIRSSCATPSKVMMFYTMTAYLTSAWSVTMMLLFSLWQRMRMKIQIRFALQVLQSVHQKKFAPMLSK